MRISKNPLISVIVPFYNSLLTIDRCIESILNQSFDNFELILVDDGSNDGSKQVAESFSRIDKRIRILQQQNQGVSVARNTGIEHSLGKYIAFCDADDYYGKDRLYNLYEKIENNDIVFTNYLNVNENGNIIKETSYLNRSFYLESKKEHLDFIINVIFQKKCSWTVSCLVKRNIIVDNDIRFNTKCGNFGEDLGFVLESLLYSKNVLISDDNSYFYVSHSGSMSDKNNDVIRMDSMNEIAKSFYERCKRIGYKKYEKILAIIHFLIMYGQYYKMIGKSVYPELKKEIRKINDRNFYYQMVKRLLFSYKEICEYTDKRTAKQILLFTNYCLHGNWERFKIESAVFYKFLI